MKLWSGVKSYPDKLVNDEVVNYVFLEVHGIKSKCKKGEGVPLVTAGLIQIKVKKLNKQLLTIYDASRV